MTEQRTTASSHQAFGHGFTMITGVGGAPVDRSTADRMCRGQEAATGRLHTVRAPTPAVAERRLRPRWPVAHVGSASRRDCSSAASNSFVRAADAAARNQIEPNTMTGPQNSRRPSVVELERQAAAERHGDGQASPRPAGGRRRSTPASFSARNSTVAGTHSTQTSHGSSAAGQATMPDATSAATTKATG